MATFQDLEVKLGDGMNVTGDINYERWDTHKQKEEGSDWKTKKGSKLSYFCITAFLLPSLLGYFCSAFLSQYLTQSLLSNFQAYGKVIFFFNLVTNTIGRKNYARDEMEGVMFRGCLKSQTALLCPRFRVKENYVKLAKLISKNSDVYPVCTNMPFWQRQFVLLGFHSEENSTSDNFKTCLEAIFTI